jgi:hypothetical protein
MDPVAVARAAPEQVRRSVPAWVPVASILLGAAWGSNQFTPMLLVYRRTLDLSPGTLEAMFGLYALGLIPGLLVAGSLADARGRRPVALASAVFSLAATVALIVAGGHVWLLFAGRLLAGVGSGAAFSAGTAWVREISRPPFGDSDDHAIARRSAVAMTLGFAAGPLVSGVLAEWAPDPGVVPYLPHLVLMSLVVLTAPAAPETHRRRGTGAIRRAVPLALARDFRRTTAPMAPWVFAAPAIAFALMPSVVGAARAGDGIALTAAVTMLTALAGVLVQPVARRLDARPGRPGASLALVTMTVGLGLAALTAAVGSIWMLVPSSLVLGAGYGMALVAGLVEVQRAAGPDTLAGLTAVFYALTYVGFAAPYVLTLAAGLAGYPVLLAITAMLALATAALVRRGRAWQRCADPNRG